MNFNSPLFKYCRILLFPFSLLYGFVIVTRNFLFDKNILRSVSFNQPIIAVGNLSTGGTGKTPMVEYLISLLKDSYQTATLSRGYKRQTKGYVLANAATTASEIGDEPMQFHHKFPGVAVAVGEQRIVAILQLLSDCPETEVVILDDALQHRSVKPSFSILLTKWDDLFIEDFFLPAGNLRDQRSSYKRANVIVVTKCPQALSKQEKENIKKKIAPLQYQHVFFSAIQYGVPYHIVSRHERTITLQDEVLLVCAIASPKLLKSYLSEQSKNHLGFIFSDHHHYTADDIVKIRKHFAGIEWQQKIIITTEKDAVKLMEFTTGLADLPVFVLPVQHHFLFGESIQFDNLINTFIEKFPNK